MKISIEEATLSVPIVTVTPTQATVVNIATQSDDEVEVLNLISSLSKLFEKKKSVKSFKNTLTSVLERLQKIVSSVDTTIDIEQQA